MSTPEGPTTSWVAPSGSAPTAPSSSLTSSPHLPPNAPPGPMGFPPPPQRPRMHPGAIAGIIGGIVVLAGALVAGFFLAQNFIDGLAEDYEFPIAEDLPPGDSTPLLDGEPGSPLAVDPTECDAECFDADTIGDVILSDSVFASLALTEHTPWYPTQSTTAADEFEASHEGWEQSEFGPDECFFTWPYAPLSEKFEAGRVEPDPVDYIGMHSDLDYYNQLDQVTRLFPDAAAASAHMVALDERIGECPRYVDLIGLRTDFITRSPAIEVPDSVAAVGWIQKTQYNERFYVIDVQRGNLVVRTTGYSTGGFSELEFRDLVEQQAELLAELEAPAS